MAAAERLRSTGANRWLMSAAVAAALALLGVVRAAGHRD
jgi:hypothetical protein